MNEFNDVPKAKITARSWEPVLDCFDREKIEADRVIPGAISVGSVVRLEPFSKQLARRAEGLPDDPVHLFDSGHSGESL